MGAVVAATFLTVAFCTGIVVLSDFEIWVKCLFLGISMLAGIQAAAADALLKTMREPR